MAVVSCTEAIEICKANGWSFDHCYMGKGKNEGDLMMLAHGECKLHSQCIISDEMYDELLAEYNKSKQYIVYTITQSGILYVGKSGTTFLRTEAKIFPFDKAKDKAYFMTKNGNYNWQYDMDK